LSFKLRAKAQTFFDKRIWIDSVSAKDEMKGK
jgi:hypothetical protein